MKNRYAWSVLWLIFSLAMVAGTAQAEDRYGHQKVVYHINYDDPKHQVATLRNIQNHINAVGQDNIEIKVVLHGNGVNLLKDAKSNEKVQQDVLNLRSQKVKFEVCNNTLKGRKISYENDLFEVFKEDIVPSGVAELSRLQQMGYTYIKP